MPYLSFEKRRPWPNAILSCTLAGALALCACGDDGSPGAPSDAGIGPDAQPPQCSELTPLTIGQCIDEATAMPCLDFVAPTRSWTDIDTQPIVPPIIGLQGSPMFVLSVSGLGIEEGLNSTAPYVELEVTQGDDLVGAYSARPAVLDDPNAPGNTLAPQLYVVAFLAEGMAGQTVQVRAQVRDLNEDQWCTEGSFQVGTLVGAP